jgi:hypothetical protein
MKTYLFRLPALSVALFAMFTLAQARPNAVNADDENRPFKTKATATKQPVTPHFLPTDSASDHFRMMERVKRLPGNQRPVIEPDKVLLERRLSQRH